MAQHGGFKKATAHRSLAKRRRMAGLTQHQLSEATGIGVNRIVFIETGRVIPEHGELERIRAVLKQSLKQRAREIGREVVAVA